MLKGLQHKRREAGDTIVEVMIVLAVLSLSLSISYATANRSLLYTRQAQENAQATELTQSQIENLRVLAPTSTPSNTNATTNIFLPTAPYCVNNVNASPPISHSCSSGLYTYQVYDCASISTGPCNGVGNSNTLVIQTTWADVLDQGTDSVTLTYKAYPTLP